LLAYLGLTPLGVWHDEYSTLGHVRDDGFALIKLRILHWSPRPLSELFIYVYGLAVAKLNRPLVTSALLPCWALLIACTIIPSVATRKGLVASSALLVLFLLGHKVDEVFYWPIGALAYMPTLAAIACLLTIDFAGFSDTTTGRVVALVALVVAATSAEIGALFAAGYCVLAFIVSVATRDRLAAWWALPFAVSLGVLYLMLTGRAAQMGEVYGDRSIVHEPVSAVLAAVRLFFGEVVGTDVPSDPLTTTLSILLSKVTFFFGTYFLFSRDPEASCSRRQWMRLVLAVSLIGASFLILAAGFYQFGLSCCQRHATMRQCYILIAIGSLALFVARWRPIRAPSVGTLLLIVAILLPLRIAARDLASDYQNYRAIVAGRVDLWTAGLGPDSPMIVPLVQPARIAGGNVFAVKTYSAADKNIDTLSSWIMYFFRKTSITFQIPTK
jgi:hypothetical protein